MPSEMRERAIAQSRLSRVVIENVRPCVDGGRFAIKRTSGETITVTAIIHADGHNVLRAVLALRNRAREWREHPMESLGNDYWRGSFQVDEPGEYEYQISAWIDRFATWRHEVGAKFAAGEDVSSELREGADLMRSTAAHAAEAAGQSMPRGGPESKTTEPVQDNIVWLRGQSEAVDGAGYQPLRVTAALDDRLAEMMARYDPRSNLARSALLPVTVDRERARFGAWYEMFPRSAGTDPSRGATLREAEARLRDIADMGFDVVYLPPIHPIGRTFRKGPNGQITSDPHDPGSPWAIGSEAGGHDAVEPSLGTLEDFDHFLTAAGNLGLEVALDLAFQASPDHPYVREHPEWFRHRPDGTIKFAENPPKKYQDIYPFDFESADRAALWLELRRIVFFWIERGVQIFRVDNPHTKPYVFWEWLIREIREIHPDVIFLAEAFTRPAVMRYLAKLGFSQSYTYFTWRNTKTELVEYFTELTQTEVNEYFRPNLFANTPDILHEYLQKGGRPAFQIRLVLAATLGASYGIYSGFELCEHEAVPGTEEYLHSEKFEYRPRDWSRPGHIKDLVRAVNRMRVAHHALRSDAGLRFFEADNPNLIFYGKTAPDGDCILVIVNLDPAAIQEGQVRMPLDLLRLPANQPYEVVDLLDGARYTWQGEWNYVRLDPQVGPAHIFTVT